MSGHRIEANSTRYSIKLQKVYQAEKSMLLLDMGHLIGERIFDHL